MTSLARILLCAWVLCWHLPSGFVAMSAYETKAQCEAMRGTMTSLCLPDTVKP
jgi:hypothetical protein